MRSARFICDTAAYLQNSHAPAHDIFGYAGARAVASVVVVPLFLGGAAVGGVYFSHGQACDWVNIRGALLVGSMGAAGPTKGACHGAAARRNRHAPAARETGGHCTTAVWPPPSWPLLRDSHLCMQVREAQLPPAALPYNRALPTARPSC